MREGLPTGTVTFLFTDVEGSTRLLHEFGAEAYAEALDEHRRLIREACAAEGGVEVDTQGDAFFFAFPTAPGALAAAADFTQGLASGPIRVRVGLHTGTPLLTDEGYVGGDVHRAARIAAAGYGGQVLVSAPTASLVELELSDLGEHRLKDLSAPERIFQLAGSDFPPLKTLYRTNLPVPATPFLGREGELAQVVELLTMDGVRLLTLTGPGGTGKTRLALQAAAAASESFPDGVFWVPLAPLRDPELVLPSLARTLAVSEEPGTPLGDTLVAHLSGKTLLLLLDNVEHLLPPAAERIAALRATNGTCVLVTSRERLRIGGEQTWPVPPLAEEDGADLFVARAQAVDPSFAPSAAVDELCARLDELPLAIELAAARTAVFSVEQLLERLSQRLDLLKGDRDADPRQQTLRATIEWSHDLLSEDEKHLFAHLAVFAGGCSYEAAEAIAGADPDTLQSLLDKSLLRKRDADRAPRYWMLETIREFAAEQLARGGASDEVAGRHLDHYLALARVFLAQVAGQYDLDEIETERDNLRVAIDTALALSPTRAVELVGCLGKYWIDRGHFTEGRMRVAAALAAATDAPPPLRARALRVAGSLAAHQADFEAAKRLVQQSLRLSRDERDRKGTGAALNVLGIVAWFRGDLGEATALFEQAVDEYDAAASDTVGLDARILHGRQVAAGNLAGVAVDSGDRARAIELGREIVNSARGRDDYALVLALNSLGLALEATEETDEARACFEEGIAVSRSHGFSAALAYMLASLAHFDGASRAADALEHYRESLVLMHDMGDDRGIAYCLEGLGAIALSGADAVRATTLLAAAATIRERTGAVLQPNELAEVDGTIAQATEALGVEAFSASWSDGRRLDRDQAVGFALSVTA